MITNHILEDKWQVQKALSEQAGHDPGRYIELTHEGAVEAQKLCGIQFRYLVTVPSVLEDHPRR